MRLACRLHTTGALLARWRHCGLSGVNGPVSFLLKI